MCVGGGRWIADRRLVARVKMASACARAPGPVAPTLSPQPMCCHPSLGFAFQSYGSEFLVPLFVPGDILRGDGWLDLLKRRIEVAHEQRDVLQAAILLHLHTTNRKQSVKGKGKGAEGTSG